MLFNQCTLDLCFSATLLQGPVLQTFTGVIDFAPQYTTLFFTVSDFHHRQIFFGKAGAYPRVDSHSAEVLTLPINICPG
jgi:hypothetical protein